MNGNSTCAMPMTTPVWVRISLTPLNPAERSSELMTPESCSRMTQDSVRTTPLTQNGISTQSTSTRRTRGPTAVIR